MPSTSDSTELDERASSKAPDLREDAVRAAPATRAGVSPGSPDDPAERAAIRPAPPRSARRWVRPALFVLLPIVLIVGGSLYVTGGQVTSMDDANVEADKVGVSTDVSGIVREVDVAENQHVEAGQVLFVLDDLPFRLALERADAQVGVTGNGLNALKANYADMQAQIKQGQSDVEYYRTEFGRQQALLNAHVASESTYDAARRNL